MDDQVLKRKKQQEFEQALLDEQEASREADIEVSRERDRLQKEGDAAQAELLQQEEQMLGNSTAQQERELLAQQQNAEFEDQLAEQNEAESGQQGADESGFQQNSGRTQKSSDKPKFPFIFIPICIGKDFLDILLDLTGVGAIVVSIYNIFFNGVYFVWRKWRGGKLEVSATKKALLQSKTTARMALMFGVEVIPFIGMLPLTTMSVFHFYKMEMETWREEQKEKLVKRKSRG